MGRYLSILSRRAALLPFVAAVVARLPVAMAPLGIVILIQGQRGNYSVAGVVTAAFAVGASISAPGWGRLMDRRGQSIVIGPLSAVSALLLALLTASTVRGADDVVLVATSAGVGLTFPPVSPAMRAAWRAALESDRDRKAAYALDAVAIEMIFVGGPLLLSLLVLVAPVAPLLVTAGLLGGGGVAYALTGTVRAWRPEPALRRAGPRGAAPLRSLGVRLVLGLALAMAVGFGLADVAIAATAREELGSTSSVGMLFAAIAGGSALGGLWYGSRPWRRPEHLRLPFSLGGFAVGLAVIGTLLAAGQAGPRLLLPVLFTAGLCISPSLIILANLVDHHGPPARLSEAQAWLNTSFTSGSALGTALAGVAVDTGGPARAFLGAAVAVAVSLLGSFATLWLWRY